MTRKQLVALIAVCVVAGPASAQEVETKKTTSNARKNQADAMQWWLRGLHPAGAAGTKCSNCHKQVNDLTGLWAGVPEGAVTWSVDPGQQGDRALSQFYQDLMLGAGQDSTYLTWVNRPALRAGISLAAPDDATRAMLGLPEGAGLVVAGVCPSEKEKLAGLQKHDIVLSINEKPVTEPKSVDAVFAALDEVTLQILRKGKKQELKRPAMKKAAAAGKEQRFLIGVTLGELDPVVRAQLDLSDDVRVFVKDVAEDGAAKKAGVKPHDILLKIDDQPATDSETVQVLVRDSGGKPMSVQLLRGKKKQEIELAASPVAIAVLEDLPESDLADPVARYIQINDVPAKGRRRAALATVNSNESVEKKLADIEKKIDELSKIIRELSKQ